MYMSVQEIREEVIKLFLDKDIDHKIFKYIAVDYTGCVYAYDIAPLFHVASCSWVAGSGGICVTFLGAIPRSSFNSEHCRQFKFEVVSTDFEYVVSKPSPDTTTQSKYWIKYRVPNEEPDMFGDYSHYSKFVTTCDLEAWCCLNMPDNVELLSVTKL